MPTTKGKAKAEASKVKGIEVEIPSDFVEDQVLYRLSILFFISLLIVYINHFILY